MTWCLCYQVIIKVNTLFAFESVYSYIIAAGGGYGGGVCVTTTSV